MEIQGKESYYFSQVGIRIEVLSKLRVRDSRKCLLETLKYYLNTYQNIRKVART